MCCAAPKIPANDIARDVVFRVVGDILLVLIAGTVSAQNKMVLKEQAKNQIKPYCYFEDPKGCEGCHIDKFKPWNVSQHSKGFTGDFFQKQFYDLVLASESFAPEVANVKDGCIGCHSPSAFLSGEIVPRQVTKYDNHWKKGDGDKSMAERGMFCDFCHTLSLFKNTPPYNHDSVSAATAAVAIKFGDLELPWSPHHETVTSEIFEDPMICSSCQNELNSYNVWVKSTFTEYYNSVYAGRGIRCQSCHMQHMGGKPAKMGLNRPHNSDHWFGGGFSDFVEGAARVEINLNSAELKTGEQANFSVDVQAVATRHKFPTGSSEECDVWLRVALVKKSGKELVHIPVPKNTDDPNDKYFITSNKKEPYPSHSKLSEPFECGALPEGDRLYHSVFLESEGKFTYAQWFCVKTV